MKRNLFLFLVLFTAFLLRLPSLYEPNWYGDEGIYQTIGIAVSQGRLLYAGIWDNKPPLLYIIYALFAGDQFWVRFSSLIVMLFTIVVFHVLALKLLASRRAVRIATALFAVLFATPLLEGNIANSENFMLLPIILAMVIVFKFSDGGNQFPRYLFAGLLFGLAFLLKIVAVFDLAAAVVFLYAMWFQKDMRQWFMKSFFLGFGFAIPLAITFLYFFLAGALSDFITAVFSQNVAYIGAGNKFLIGQGLLLLKLAVLFLFCFLVYVWRNILSKENVFIYLWLAFSIFNAFFGGRPWIHYLLTLLPAFCLFIGIIIQDKKLRTVNLVLGILLFFLIYKNFWIYGKTISYYENFLGFVSNTKATSAYLDSFDWYVSRDYEIASYLAIHTMEDDTIFLWGDNAQIYVLSKRMPAGRYTVSYHVTFYKEALSETKEAIMTAKPAFIVAIRDDFPEILLGSEYIYKREIRGAKLYARRI